MNNLPQEIIERIVSFLPGGSSAEWSVEDENHPTSQYAVISNKFCAAIERSMFKRLRINNEELETFAQVLTPSRRGFLRFLSYSIVLPPVDEAVSHRYERPAETKAVKEERELKLYEEIDEFPEYRDLRSRINLLAPNVLPRLTFISRLVMSDFDRRLTSSVQIDLAARMPGLQALDLVSASNEVRYPGVLRKDRCILASALKLRSEETKKISVATLDMSVNDGDGALHQLLPMPDLIYPSGYDPLGSSLRTWSQRLTNFVVKGVVNEALFWPHALETTSSHPQWLNLKDFYVQLERHTPSGWWYFMPKGKPKFGTPPRNPAEDPNDLPQLFTDNPIDGADPFDKWDEYDWDCERGYAMPVEDFFTRNFPNEDTMQPLLEGWAKALRSMPSLQRATLAFKVEIPDSRSSDEDNVSWDDWEVIYESPESTSSYVWERNLAAGERSSRRLTFHNTRGWRPNRNTMDLLQRIGEDSYPETKLVVLAVNEWKEVLR
ncbi:hypothetical protein V502_06087 [Pseudogymnoascus sp. VKM F-4520 (FW-2644)]|nr:hypothetical protein V502_06087 [Pseudogymnoascus sp. VKM F-4520 (FW-2644)]